MSAHDVWRPPEAKGAGEREDPGGGPAAGETESCLVLIPEAREASAGAIVAGVTDGADGNPRLWRTNKAQGSAAGARPVCRIPAPVAAVQSRARPR